jgi:hypothetical protein
MKSKDFALFSTLRTIYVNEEPDRFNPYLLSLNNKRDSVAESASKKAFDICSVSSDDSDEDAVIFIRKKEEPVPCHDPKKISQDECKQIQKKKTEQFL